jgi:hypothetical protein
MRLSFSGFSDPIRHRLEVCLCFNGLLMAILILKLQSLDVSDCVNKLDYLCL